MAKRRYLIKRVEYAGCEGEKVATGFVLAGVCGDVDPFVGGEFVGCDDFESQAEMNEWYESQVGKHLFCNELVVRAVATYGKTYIS